VISNSTEALNSNDIAGGRFSRPARSEAALHRDLRAVRGSRAQLFFGFYKERTNASSGYVTLERRQTGRSCRRRPRALRTRPRIRTSTTCSSMRLRSSPADRSVAVEVKYLVYRQPSGFRVHYRREDALRTEQRRGLGASLANGCRFGLLDTTTIAALRHCGARGNLSNTRLAESRAPADRDSSGRPFRGRSREVECSGGTWVSSPFNGCGSPGWRASDLAGGSRTRASCSTSRRCRTSSSGC